VVYELIVIGASLGGLEALTTLLSGLPEDFPLPVVIVQHRAAESDDPLRELLQQRCAVPVSEGEDKETTLPGRVYLAPADYHLLVENGNFALSTEAPVLYARPSIDVLFESAADAYGEKVIGVILTGASAGGARGVSTIKKRGGMIVVQDPATAESPVMPDAAIAAADVDRILPIAEIAPFLVGLCPVVRNREVENEVVR
jgi:two-component system chemotaxis response regulator CheB